jgi:Fe-Mn family superoxide dismutase
LLMNENGWIWLVLDSRNELKVINTSGNKNPWNSNMKPLMSIDMWEHSYYIDYGANKRNYVERVFEKLLDWSRINQLYKEYNLECT